MACLPIGTLVESVPDLPEEDIIYLGEGFKKKETVIAGEENSQTTRKKAMASRNRTRQDFFRLMDLPAELRVFIYQYLLPHGLVFTFNHCGSENHWIVYGHVKDDSKRRYLISRPYRSKCGMKPRGLAHHKIETQLFLVNKTISNEARAVLYGSNTYTFRIDGNPRFPKSLQSPQIFGPFGDTPPGGQSRLPLLRNLRHIKIIVSSDCRRQRDYWVVKRQHARLEYFVQILSQHSNDVSKRSLLQGLTVQCGDRNPNGGFDDTFSLPYLEKHMFGLESLAALRGIKRVDVTGVPDWYAKCLQLCIQGQGGDVQETDWPLVEVKRQVSGAVTKRYRKVWVTTRRWYQPLLNWKEYAERNGVEVPDDIDRFWMDIA